MYSLDLRWTACHLYYQRYQSVRKTADALFVGKSTISRWLQDHPISRKIRKQNAKHEELTRSIVEAFQSNPFHSLSSLHSHLSSSYKVSRSTLARCVRKTGWTKKSTSKLQLKSKHQDQLEKTFIERMKPYEGCNWISIDETCIWTDMYPTKGYAPIGKRCNLHTQQKSVISTRKKLSLSVAVSRSGQTYCFLKEGSVLSSDFAHFISQLPFPSSSLLAMDNASIHKTKEVRNQLEQKQYQYVFTAPYRPDWNPIEHLFSPFKHHFRSLIHSQLSVIDRIHKTWQLLPSSMWEISFCAVERRWKEWATDCLLHKENTTLSM